MGSETRLRTAFCVSGHGSLFRAAVARCDEIGIEPVLLILETKSAGDLDDFARTRGIAVMRLDPLDRAAFDAAVTKALLDEQPDLTALTFDRILPAATVEALQYRIINVHPALLPAFAGTRGIERTLAAGVKVGGATIHEVIAEVDAGPIIAQAAVEVLPDDDVVSYGRRLYARLEPMFLQVLRWFAEGRVEHDAAGRVVVRGARYDSLPVVPALEPFA